MYTKQLLRICPDSLDAKASLCRQVRKFRKSIFVRVFCPDAFTELEADLCLSDMHRLVSQADQVHFNPALVGIIKGVMSEMLYLEIGFQLLIDAFQQVLIEPGRHTLRVVVGPVQDGTVLLQIDADQLSTSLADPGYPA